MKRLFPAAILAALTLTSITPAQANENALPPVGDDWQAQYTNGIAAVVEGDIITVDELRSAMAPRIAQLQRKARTRDAFDREVEALSFYVLGQLIDNKLILKDFEDVGMQIPSLFLEKEYASHINSEFGGNRTEFLGYLRQRGISPTRFKEELKERMIVDYMRGQQRTSQTVISPQNIIKYYNQHPGQFEVPAGVHLRQIMLPPSAEVEAAEGQTAETPAPATQAQLVAEIEQALEAGTPFEALAKQYSADDKSESGGDWGWVNREDLHPKVADVAYALEAGQWSAPIEIDGFAFFVFVEDKRPGGKIPLEEARDGIEKLLVRKNAMEAEAQWLARLRKNAYIKYYL